MEAEQNLIKVRDEVFRKIGRNLLNFQKIEQLLKAINTCSGISGFASELENNLKRRAEEIHNQTMGTLVKQLIENTYFETNHAAKLDAEIAEPYLSVSLGFNVENRTHSMKSLVDERNNLVHHLLPQINLLSIESCLEMDRFLDEQRERQRSEHNQLSSLLKNISETWAMLQKFYDSDEGLKAVDLSLLQSSVVVSSLCDLSTRLARPDGWALLDNAGRELHSILTDEIANLKMKRGYKSLKEIILACDLFEVSEEATKKGGTRVLFRLRPELQDIYH